MNEAERLAEALEQGTYLLSQERNATAAELRRLSAINAELINVLTETKLVLQRANDTVDGPINDTIWMMNRPETLFDFLDVALEKAKQ